MKFLVASLLVLLSVSCASHSAERYARLAAHDVTSLGTSVRHADSATWKRAALIGAGVVATATLDNAVERAVGANHNGASDSFADRVEPLGGRYSDRVLAGFLIAGLVRNDQKAKAVAFDGLISSVIASKVITPALKELIGRNRPSEGNDAFRFDGGSSFPSNHSTQAFALATVIASHYDQRWVDITAYGLATAVAYSRIYHDAHYFSDVVAGAAIGTAVGKFVTRTNDRARERWTISPLITPNAHGILISTRR